MDEMDEITKVGLLAMTFGATLFTALDTAKAAGELDSRTATELAVFSRIMEKRLGDMRQALPTNPKSATAAAQRLTAH